MNYLKILWNLFKLRNQTKMTSEQIKILQDKKLRKLLHHVWDHSVYYRRTFEKAGITEKDLDTLPLSCFPSITKQELLGYFDELVTKPELKQEEIREFDRKEEVDRKPYQGNYHIVHSSGSTGKPGYFVYDEEAWQQMLLGIIRGALWGMSMPQIIRLLISKPRIVYIAATDGRYGGAMAVGDGIDGVGASQMYVDINEPLEEWIRKLGEFQPNVVIGYPSAIKIMAELKEEGKLQANVKRVISCGEPLGLSLRNYLETVFQAPVVNIYGSSESLALGVETDPEEGMLLFDDLNMIEMESGQMYLTCLYNYTQPLIRYRLTDSLVLETPGEEAFCPFTKAMGLLGRNEDILWFTDGEGKKEFLHPLAVEGFCIDGLKDYQFRKIAEDVFEMYAETTMNACKESIRKEMLGQMQRIPEEKELGYMQFYVNFVDEIFPDPHTGKKPLILPEINAGKECYINEQDDIAG